jgi:hypothetical protein
MRKIFLTKGQSTIVDDEDFPELSLFKWQAHKSKNDNTFYAQRRTKKGITEQMHRRILKLSFGDGKIVDHINRNGLDNRKCNLRIATPSLNSHNSKIHRHNTTGFRGVSYHKATGKYQSRIKINNKTIYLGVYETAILASQVYNSYLERCGSLC